jgi:hypothetical protein
VGFPSSKAASCFPGQANGRRWWCPRLTLTSQIQVAIQITEQSAHICCRGEDLGPGVIAARARTAKDSALCSRENIAGAVVGQALDVAVVDEAGAGPVATMIGHDLCPADGVGGSQHAFDLCSHPVIVRERVVQESPSAAATIGATPGQQCVIDSRSGRAAIGRVPGTASKVAVLAEALPMPVR